MKTNPFINPDKAVYWYRRSAEMGDNEGMFALSGIYLDGQFVPPDLNESIKWLEKAAEAAIWPVQPAMAAVYLTGRTGTVDKIQAYKWDSIECLDEVRATHAL